MKIGIGLGISRWRKSGTSAPPEAPTVSGPLGNQSTQTGAGIVTYTTSGSFTGSGLTYSLIGAPTWVGINPSAGAVTFSRASAVPGEFEIQVRATNAGGSVATSFLLAVQGAAPTGDEWALIDNADGSGLTLDILTAPIWATSADYSINSGVWQTTGAIADVVIGIASAPINQVTSVAIRWRANAEVGLPSVAKTATATIPADIIQYVAAGTVGSAPANWTSRWATGALTYQDTPSRLEMTTGSGVFWSMDTDNGRDLSNVSGAIDFNGTFVLNASGHAEAGVAFWATGTAVGDRNGYFACIRESAATKQVALYSYTAGAPATMVTFTHGFQEITGPGALWTLRAKTEFISGSWRAFIKAWPNTVSEPLDWQIDNYVIASPIQTIGRIGIASRSASTGAPFSVATLNIGINGAAAPGSVVLPSGSYKAGAALFVDLASGDDSNPGTSSAAPLLTFPGYIDPGCVVKIRGRTTAETIIPNGSTSGAGRITLDFNDPVFAAGNRGTLSGEATMTALTDIGGQVWSGILPADAWSTINPNQPATGPNLEAVTFFRNGTKMRLAQYPTQPSLTLDQVFARMFPVPSTNSTTPTAFTVPNDPIDAIPEASVRAQVHVDYPTATTIRDVVNLIHAAEPLQTNSWLILWGEHNTRQKSRIASYTPATGEMVLTDAVTAWSIPRTTYFSIANHPAALRSETQVLTGFASGQFKLISATNPNGQVTYAQVRKFILDVDKNNVIIDGVQIERVSCPVTGDAPLRIKGPNGVTSSGVTVRNCIVSNCAANEAAALVENPVDFVFRNNLIEDIYGRCILAVGGNKAVITNNTFRRSTNTPLSVRYANEYVVATNIVEEINGTHSNLMSVYEDNDGAIIVGNRLSMLLDMGATQTGLTTHRLRNCMFAFNEVLTPINQAFQQWSTSGPRETTSGSNRYSNNTFLHVSPSRLAGNGNKAFNITSLANGQGIVTNNLVNALCFNAFEDATLTYSDASFDWREALSASAVMNGGGTVTPVSIDHGRGSILGAVADNAELVFGSGASYVDIVISNWATAVSGAGADCLLDLRQPATASRKIPAIDAELIVTTTSGVLPTGTATWPVTTTSATDLRSAWVVSNTARVLGQASATVTSVTIRLRPGAGYVAGVADTVLISRPRAWRDRAERLSRRRYNLVTTNTQGGATLDTLDRYTAVSSPLINMTGPLPGDYNLAPRELSPGVLAEPWLAEGDAWTFAPPAAMGALSIPVTWTGAIRPNGTRVDLSAVDWWGLGF